MREPTVLQAFRVLLSHVLSICPSLIQRHLLNIRFVSGTRNSSTRDELRGFGHQRETTCGQVTSNQVFQELWHEAPDRAGFFLISVHASRLGDTHMR